MSTSPNASPLAVALFEAFARNGGNRPDDHFDRDAAEQWMQQALDECMPSPAAAQEAVAWQVGDDFYTSESLAIEGIQQWGPSGSIAIPLYAAPVAAAQEAVAWMTRKALDRFAEHRAGNADAAASSYAYAMPDDDCFVPLYAAPVTAAQEAVAWTKAKPSVEGDYYVRGFNLFAPKQYEALVQVRTHHFAGEPNPELVCNLHESTSSEEMDDWSPIVEMSDDFEWRGPLFAAPVAAAQVDGLHLAVIGRNHFGNPIPQEWYAAARELLASTPAAPGIDRSALTDIIDWWDAYTGPVDAALGEVIRRIRALIDASPKGGSDAFIQLHAIEGMTVSVDVDSLFDTDGRRLFGTVTEVMECRGDPHGFTLLVQDAEPNWDSPKGGSDALTIPEPHLECYSNNDGDSWYEHPADYELVQGLKVGDTYTLDVSHYSVERTYRVTKAPDETSDDYEVEPVQATSAEVGSWGCPRCGSKSGEQCSSCGCFSNEQDASHGGGVSG